MSEKEVTNKEKRGAGVKLGVHWAGDTEVNTDVRPYTLAHTHTVPSCVHTEGLEMGHPAGKEHT